MGRPKKQRVDGENSKCPKMTWKDEMDAILLDAFIQEQEKGNRVDGTWTTQAYTNIVKYCSEKFGYPIEKDHVKNRLRTLKANFGVCHDLFHGLSGFGWNQETRMFEADPEVWKDKIEVKPEIGKWRYTPISHYDKMELLFAKDRANGRGAISAKERLRQWAREYNPINLDEPITNVDSPFSFEVGSVFGNNQVEGDTPKGGKSKAAVVDLLERQIEVINSGINGVAEALKEGNAIVEKIAEKQIALVERSCPKVYTEDEVYAELLNIGVLRDLLVNALLYLIKSPVDLRAFFAVPSDMRLELLYKLMNS